MYFACTSNLIAFNKVRKKIGDDKIIGVSCYGDIDRCIKFSDLGADYIAIGTPYFTKTKPDRERTDLDQMSLHSTTFCAICIEPITSDKKVCVLECGHIYHQDCISPWFNSQMKQNDKPTCPTCRGGMETLKLEIHTV